MSKYLEDKRTVFSLNDVGVNHVRHNIGLLIFIIVFAISIPYLLVQYKQWALLSGYFPNLDLIATTIGYHEGPTKYGLWKHLYNPADSTITGYISSNIINLFALLGVTYIISYFTFTTNSIYKGWSRAFIMLPMTYFIPNNIVVYIMNKFGKLLNRKGMIDNLWHYLLVVILGLIICLGFIIVEAGLIELFTPMITKLLKALY
jgi:hypothetical protein